MTIDSVGNGWIASTSASTATSGKRLTQSSNEDFSLALDSLILPTRENAQKLSAGLSKSLRNAFQQAGIPATPPVDLSVDPSSGHISVSSNRSDTRRIEDLINGNAELAEQVRTTHAIWSHVPGIERSLQFETEYMASSNPQAVVAKYSDLFGPQASSSYALRFTGAGVQALVDNRGV